MTHKTPKKLKIIQLAAYRSNVGDNANIVGTRRLLNQNLGHEIEYTDLEITDFLWGRKTYDDQFVDLVNRHELLLIGGGGYFELTRDETCSGTPLDISVETLSRISIPIVFNALGMDTAKGVNKERVEKFKRYLDYLLSSDRILVSVRNDGTTDTVRRLLGDDYADRLHQVPDGGFFTEVEDFDHVELPADKQVIGINLAGDMLELRFPANGGPGQLHTLQRMARKLIGHRVAGDDASSVEQFLIILGRLMNDRLARDPDLHLVMFPHIFRDLHVIHKFISRVGVPYGRSRITVAPYAVGKRGQDYMFDAYRKCELVLGMRFHANVCPIGLDVPTIGLVSYPQIEQLYHELNLDDRAVRVNQEDFTGPLGTLVDDSLINKANIKKRFALTRSRLLERANSFHKVMRDWLDSTSKVR